MKKISRFRKTYINRLIIRILIFLIVIFIYIWNPNTFSVVKEFNFLFSFSPLHILWIIWMFDMILQLCKAPKYWPLGSQKYRKDRFIPFEKLEKKLIKKRMRKMNRDIFSIAITWILFVAIIDLLYLTNTISYQIVVLCSVFFYVCDTICVVVWCPFRRFFMHNKCCTTCRIFNWDHAMMFLPLIVIPGLWTYSLIIMSFIILFVWEYCCFTYPERFHEKSNCALRCSNCEDKLCGK